MAERKAKCHPEEKHYAKGMCRTCYLKSINTDKRRKANNESATKYRAANKHKAKDGKLKARYGIDRAQVQEMTEKQGNLCAICNNPMDVPNVDHHHDTETVRGLLCRKCNIAIGLFKECTKTMLNAVRYLLFWETRYKEVKQ